MTEPVDPPPAPPVPPLPKPVIVRTRRARFSLVWLVPIVALAVGALKLARTIQQRGPQITITFRNAEGLEANHTEVRFKEVVVGRVTKVALSPDRERVIASVSLDKSVESLAVADTRFWVVRPRINTAGVSGLGTLFSGAYIGVDAGVSDVEQTDFTGLEVPPYVLRGEPGRSFTLIAEDLGSLEVGSPVLYRRTRVGRVVGFELDPVRDRLGVRIFIDAPNDKLVTTGSRFWNASGIDVTLGASGFTVDTQSVASVLIGGVAFANPDGAASAPAAPADQRFRMTDSQKAALAPPDGPPLRVRMVFNKSLRGLAAGAPVDLLGVEIGSVHSVSLQYDERTHHLPGEVIADIYPRRLGAVRKEFKAPPDTRGRVVDRLFIKNLVEGGLRAQMRTGNLLTGQLYVALDFDPKAKPATLDANADVLTLPSVPGAFSDLQPQLASIIGRLGKVKFDEIGSDLQQTLKGATAATAQLQDTLQHASGAIEQLSPEAQRTLTEVQDTLVRLQGTLDSAQGTLATLDRNVTRSDAPLQRSAIQALLELQRAAQALRVLGDYLQRHPESLLRGKPADAPLLAPSEGSSR
jgi:paraquat-inducible protein B